MFEKIIVRRRGGFCYELNGLFAALLRQLGFHVALLSAGVAKPDGGFGPEFDHMALLVVLEDRWLVDVGFGDTFRQPLLLDSRLAQVQGDRAYRICDEAGYLVLNESKDGSGWKAQYRFTLQPHVLSDFLAMSHFHQTSPDSIFTQRRICSLARPAGRLTLSDMRLIETKGSERREQVVQDIEEYETILESEFGINMKNENSVRQARS